VATVLLFTFDLLISGFVHDAVVRATLSAAEQAERTGGGGVPAAG